MNTWITQMPKGMQLKSEGFASSLYDPESKFPLSEYCREQGLPYADTGLPVPLETFWAYGLEFQRRYVPNLEQKSVVSVAESSRGFEISLGDGEVFTASKVVMAIGLTHFGYLPPEFASLPRELVSHSSAYGNLDRFKGKSVAVIGAGASALDIAALLHQAGAQAHLVARSKVVRFHDKPVLPRPLWQRIRRPATGIGNGWKLVFYAHAPGLFQRMPEAYRLEVVRKTLGPAPGWFVKDQVVGKVPFHLGVKVVQVAARNSQVQLELENSDATRETLAVDHVIAATGYKVDLRRLSFLGDPIRNAIRCVEQTPILSPSFESSVPGMHFVGTSSANAFGPLMRFAVGAKFTAERLTAHLAKALRGSTVAVRQEKGLAAQTS
jgi:cation diffusion facilitator CzcD-associated flavoprotein CzcO